MKIDNKGIPAFFLVFLLVLTGCGGVGEKGQPTNLSPSFSTTYPREAEDMYRQAEDAYRAGKVPNAIKSVGTDLPEVPKHSRCREIA